MVWVILKLLASLGQICQIVWAGNYVCEDVRGVELLHAWGGQPARHGWWPRTHPLSLRDLLELLKVEQVPWGTRKPLQHFQSLGSSKGRNGAYPTRQARLVSEQTFVLEELQFLQKALKAMQGAREAEASLGSKGRSPGPMLPSLFPRQLIIDTRGCSLFSMFRSLSINRKLKATKRRSKKNIKSPS